MVRGIGSLMAVVAAVVAFSMTAAGSVVYIGGTGAISTSDPPEGPLGLLSGGEVATAVLDYEVTSSGQDMYLTLTVTNTSPAFLGTDTGAGIDAPEISDIMFCAPSVVTNMTLLSVDSVAASAAGWGFAYSQNHEPGSGFGFLKNNFDAFVDGGPPAPSPVIASIFDPCLTDGPGSPTLASPVSFIFKLSFAGVAAPEGMTDDWFVNKQILGNPTYVAAAKFMSGANGGSGTVTDGEAFPLPVPAPASLLLALVGLAGIRAGFRKSIQA